MLGACLLHGVCSAGRPPHSPPTADCRTPPALAGSHSCRKAVRRQPPAACAPSGERLLWLSPLGYATNEPPPHLSGCWRPWATLQTSPHHTCLTLPPLAAVPLASSSPPPRPACRAGTPARPAPLPPPAPSGASPAGCTRPGFTAAAVPCTSPNSWCRPPAANLPCSDESYVLTPAKTCLACGPDCRECALVSPGRTRCTACSSLTLIDGVCRRCDDPRCYDCSGNVSVCKACRNLGYVVNKATGRCQDPAWPGPRQQPFNGLGHRTGNAGKPASGAAGR